MTDLNVLKVNFKDWTKVEHISLFFEEGHWSMDVTCGGSCSGGTIDYWAENRAFTVEALDGEPLEFDFDGYMTDYVEKLERAKILQLEVKVGQNSVALIYATGFMEITKDVLSGSSINICRS